ncbi:Protein FAR-RED ELONGATED HYPOCOTYL 3, partial [Bienertia sinuspersici]
ALTTNEIRSDINSESNVKDPEVGMTFPSWDAVDSYYHAYSKQRGFRVVRADVSYKQKGGRSTREKRAGIWQCDCWGKLDKRCVSKGKRVVVQSPIQKSPTNKMNSSKKCECPAMVYAKPNKCNEWELCTVVSEHKNHTPTPSKSRHIPKYRNEELNKCNVARNLFNANAAGVSIAKIHRTLVHEALILGGDENNTKVREYHSFIDGYVNKTTRLCEFPQQYSYAMEVRANEEKEAYAKCWKYTRTLLTAFPFEVQFRGVYTDAKYKEVQVQCSRVLYVTPLEKRVVGNNVVEHLLEDIVYTRTKKKREEIATMKRRSYCVWFDTASHDSGCECKHFECYGIMCHHLTKVYYMYNVEDVPSKFILRRWRKDIQRKHMVVKVAYHDLSKTAQVQRFDKLMVEFERVCLKASLLDENIHTCMELIQLLDLRVEENNTKFYESARAGDPSSVTPGSTSNDVALTSASTNCSFNYAVVPGGTHNPDQSTPCQGSMMRTQNETASTFKGTTSHSVGDPVLWRKKKGSKGGVRLQSAAKKAINKKKKKKKKKKSSTTNEQAEVNQTGLPMFGVGYRPGVVAQRLFADDPPLFHILTLGCEVKYHGEVVVTNNKFHILTLGYELKFHILTLGYELKYHGEVDYGDDCQKVAYKTFRVQDLYNVSTMERWNFPSNTPIQVLYERWAQNYNEDDRDLRLFHEEVELDRAKTVG